MNGLNCSSWISNVVGKYQFHFLSWLSWNWYKIKWNIFTVKIKEQQANTKPGTMTQKTDGNVFSRLRPDNFIYWFKNNFKDLTVKFIWSCCIEHASDYITILMTGSIS